MRLLLLGASGRTGSELLQRATREGHEVSVVVRDPERLDARALPLRLLRGTVTDATLIDDAVDGQDAVLSALGPRSPLQLVRCELMRLGIANVTASMERHGVARLVLLSAVGVGESAPHAPAIPRVAFATFLRQVGKDKARAEQIVRASELDWTIVYPPTLTNGPGGGGYRHGEELGLARPARISRADVAEFMLAQLTDHTYSRKGAIIGP